jgi:hypothetical protein
MLTRDRVILFRFSTDSASPRLHALPSRRRSSDARHLIRTEAGKHLMDSNPLEDCSLRENPAQASYASVPPQLEMEKAFFR